MSRARDGGGSVGLEVGGHGEDIVRQELDKGEREYNERGREKMIQRKEI